MTAPRHLIRLRDVAERRVWCPFSGSRAQAPGGCFAPNACCIGPRCAGWEWRGEADAQIEDRRLCHLVPHYFSHANRVRLASQLFPDLVGPFTVLAGNGSDPEAARATILSWAVAHWKPEAMLPNPETWVRHGEPTWDTEADTPALTLIRRLPDDQRAGLCGFKRRFTAHAEPLDVGITREAESCGGEIPQVCSQG